MTSMGITGTEQLFDDEVRLRYEVYNSIFLTLPFDIIRRTGTYLPILADRCREGLENGISPDEILRVFQSEQMPGADAEARTSQLFDFIKYVERQIVLFDAVEEAAFPALHDVHAEGTLDDFLGRVDRAHTRTSLRERLAEYRLRLVLTAHPTQFYPGPVLGIIRDLAAAIRSGDLPMVRELLLQLGKTPFINREKPTPLDEAQSLIWYLREVFYPALGELGGKLRDYFKAHGEELPADHFIELGFWPGGDRDGNPYVTADITRKTLELLHRAILTCYIGDLRRLRRRLTFRHVYERIVRMETRLTAGLRGDGEPYPDIDAFLADIDDVLAVLRAQYDGLFAGHLETFRMMVALFGFHFASLDIRQDSRKHEALLIHSLDPTEAEAYRQSGPDQRMRWLQDHRFEPVPEADDPIDADILESMRLMPALRKAYGPRACHRYIISNTRNAADIKLVHSLIRAVNGTTSGVDIIPLFESVDSLREAAAIMEQLYSDPEYAAHLGARERRQTIMLGFSDGTKDGGYLRANWSIFRAKEELTAQARRLGIRVIFFDGRGGPPARGGGNTHKFYSSLGPTIDNHEVQLTIQGQTISTNFASPGVAVFNLEQLFTAGLEPVVGGGGVALTDDDRALVGQLADVAFDQYRTLKEDPLFLAYLEEVGTLSYFSETNIGSRPVRRQGNRPLTLEDLRAIPFVSAWSLLKQNVPGYYGLGAAIEAGQQRGRSQDLRALYARSPFFQALVGNSMQALAKSYFPLTGHLASDPRLGPFWNRLREEYDRTVAGLLAVSGQDRLLADAPVNRSSILMREEIIRPLLVIQQAAIQRLRQEGEEGPMTENLHRLVLRTIYGIINAARNSA